MVSNNEGFMLSFKHAKRNHDEMKTWLDIDEVADIAEAARHPVYRTWEDPNGVRWLVGIEFASLREDSSTWITFRNSVSEFSTLLPGNAALGDLTADELGRLLKIAR